MATRSVRTPAFLNRTERARKARKLLAELNGRGIVLELNAAGEGFTAASYAVDERGEFLPVPPAMLERITADREAILAELLRQEESIDRWKWLLIEYNPDWREEFGRMLGNQVPNRVRR